MTSARVIPETAAARNRISLCFAGILLLAGGLSAFYVYSGCCIVFREPIRADGFGYYAYLPAWFIDHDLTMRTALAYRWTVVTTPLPYIWYGISPYLPTGKLLDKYTLGTALVQSPSFLVAHAVALASRAAPYSAPYQTATVIWAILFFMAGGYLVLRNLLERHSRTVSLLAACAVIFGTSVFHNAIYFGSYSHVYSYFMFALLLAMTDAYRKRGISSTKPLVGLAAGLGCVLGFIALLRVPNIIGGIIPLAAMAERLYRTRKPRNFALEASTLSAAFLLMFSLQMAYWHAITGHYFLNSYQHESFDWIHPQIINFLFSVHRGLFFWSPIVIIAVIGLPRFLRSEMVLGAAICVVLILEVYICASWWSWWYGASFGSRPIADMMPLIALPMASGLDWLRDRVGRLLPAVIVAMLVAANLFLMLSYWRELIRWDPVTLTDFAQLPAKWETVPLLTPAWRQSLALETLGSYSPGTPFLADSNPPSGMFLEGFDERAPSRWTVGRTATIYIRPALPAKGDLKLHITLAGPGGLLTSKHPRQRAVIVVNGTTIGKMTAIYPHPVMGWTFDLPRRLLHDGKIGRIDFELPDAVAPQDLGINTDPRLLGLYITRIDILPAGVL